MKMGISIEDATEILYSALHEGVGTLLYTTDPQYTMQMLYKARRLDPDLQEIHISQRAEGLVLWHTLNRGKGQMLW